MFSPNRYERRTKRLINKILKRKIDVNFFVNNSENIEFYNKAVEAFKTKKYIDAFLNFFNFLKEPSGKNIRLQFKGNILEFSIIHGSSLIEGFCDDFYFEVNCLIGSILEKFDCYFLLTYNKNLKYSSLRIIDGKLFITSKWPVNILDFDLVLRIFNEIASFADKMDDILPFNFSNSFQKSNLVVFEEDSEFVKFNKLNFFYENVTYSLSSLEKFHVIKQSPLRAYIILSAFYKILAILKPNGVLLELIKSALKDFYSTDSLLEANAKVLNVLRKLNELNHSQVSSCFYKTYFTFKSTNYIDNQLIVDFLMREMPKLYQYEYILKNKNIQDFSIFNVMDVIIGYCNFSVNSEFIWNEIFKIYWEVAYCKIYNKIYETSMSFSENELILKIKFLNHMAQKKYKNFNINVNHLSFSSEIDFLKSFLQNLTLLNFK